MYEGKTFEVAGFTFSDWTNEFLERCENLCGHSLHEAEILAIIDYAMGFASSFEESEQELNPTIDLPKQTLKELGYIEG